MIFSFFSTPKAKKFTYKPLIYNEGLLASDRMSDQGEMHAALRKELDRTWKPCRNKDKRMRGMVIMIILLLITLLLLWWILH